MDLGSDSSAGAETQVPSDFVARTEGDYENRRWNVFVHAALAPKTHHLRAVLCRSPTDASHAKEEHLDWWEESGK